ncbi:GPI mannosyltransferase [Trinorchestia longiramus]|nr:GPI mannosyltransferase [Trinorchestia longiramus]
MVVSSSVVVLDSLYYGELTFVPWNFLKFNVFSNLADHYGRHPWHWYVTSGVPSALGPHSVLLLAVVVHHTRAGSWQSRLLLGSCVFTLVCYSMIGHKEIRLLLPLLPPLLVLCGRQLQLLFASPRSPCCNLSVVAVTGLVVPSLLLTLYFSLLHQRGALTIMEDLRFLLLVPAAAAPSVLFLTPCHATPLYSHMHVPVPTRFLTCEPNLNFAALYVDESDRFFEDPELWLAAHLPSNSHQETHKNRREAHQTHQEAHQNRQEAHQTHQEAHQNRQEAHQTHQEAHQTHQEAHQNHQEAHQNHQETHQNHQEAHQNHQEAHQNHQETHQKDLNNTSFCSKKSSLSSMYRFEVRDPLAVYPSHVVMFDNLANSVSSFLQCSGYVLCAAAFHSYVQEKNRGKYIQVYCATDS